MTKEQMQQLAEEKYPYEDDVSLVRRAAFISGLSHSLTPSADVQERAKEIEEPDYTMSDIKEHNPDYTGNKASKDAEDYAANILTEYPDEEYVRRTPSDIRCIAEAAHLAGASSLQAENERLRAFLQDIVAEQEPQTETSLRLWYKGVKALAKQHLEPNNPNPAG